MNFEMYRNKFSDEISKIYFDARVQYLNNKSLCDFYLKIKDAGEKYVLREVEEFRVIHNIREWVVVGEDDYARYNCLILKDLGYSIIGVTSHDFCKLIPGVQFVSLEGLGEFFEKKNVGVIINQRDLQCLGDEFCDKDNLLVMFSHIVGRNGTQYFDYFSAKDNEIFLDAGSLDGATSNKFIEWCEGGFEYIYAFEPNPTMIENCMNNFRQYENKAEVFNIALWDKKEQLLFFNESSRWDARVSADGSVVVDGDTIDNILQGKRITFIKLDVEGAELNVLKGAKHTIILNRPRMAISVYHNENDLFDIMKYLISLNLDYEYAIRHYHSDFIETILYAF